MSKASIGRETSPNAIVLDIRWKPNGVTTMQEFQAVRQS